MKENDKLNLLNQKFKAMSNKKLAGIWIDNAKAVIAKNHDGSEVSEFELCDTVKHHVQHGNSNENAANNAEITNKNKFFKEIENKITNSETVFITGPGTIQEELKHHLAETAQYKNTKVVLGTSNQMSDDQVLEEVKAHFNA